MSTSFSWNLDMGRHRQTSVSCSMMTEHHQSQQHKHRNNLRSPKHNKHKLRSLTHNKHMFMFKVRMVPMRRVVFLSKEERLSDISLS